MAAEPAQMRADDVQPDAKEPSSASSRRNLLPAAGLPLLYFGYAHGCLALAFVVLVLRPALPGSFFLHPRMVAVVHLVTLGWISGSILGAFYIVAPLALRVPLRPDWRDRAAFASFSLGVAGLVTNVWLGDYRGMVASAVLVAGPVLHVCVRASNGLWQAPIPWAVKLHVGLAFGNMLGASALGMLIGLNRLYGWFPWSPLSAAFAHLHLAAIGWAMMMVVGLSYRLIPMILPARMPTGSRIATSAVLLQSGLVILVVALLQASTWTAAGALLIVGGLCSFVAHVRAIVKQRLPPPAALPQPDWATWQTHAAFLWLVVAAVFGVDLSLSPVGPRTVELGWIYGTVGLLGFLSQIVIGIQGRLLPLHAWYRAFEQHGMQPPPRSAHVLAVPLLAKWIFLTWIAGVPILTAGLALGNAYGIAGGSALLLIGVILNAAHGVAILRSASRMPETGRK